MGEHRHNPTAIAAKSGELSPKPPRLSKRQQDVWLMAKIEEVTGVRELRKAMRNGGYTDG